MIMRGQKYRMVGGWHRGEGAPQRMLAPGATNPRYATARARWGLGIRSFLSQITNEISTFPYT